VYPPRSGVGREIGIGKLQELCLLEFLDGRMAAVRCLPAGQELVQPAEYGLVVVSPLLLQLQDALERVKAIAGGPGKVAATFRLRKAIVFVGNG